MMNSGQIAMLAFEIGILILIALGVVYEPAIAEWKRRRKEKVLRAFKNRRKLRGEGTNEKAS